MFFLKKMHCFLFILTCLKINKLVEYNSKCLFFSSKVVNKMLCCYAIMLESTKSYTHTYAYIRIHTQSLGMGMLSMSEKRKKNFSASCEKCSEFYSENSYITHLFIFTYLFTFAQRRKTVTIGICKETRNHHLVSVFTNCWVCYTIVSKTGSGECKVMRLLLSLISFPYVFFNFYENLF